MVIRTWPSLALATDRFAAPETIKILSTEVRLNFRQRMLRRTLTSLLSMLCSETVTDAHERAHVTLSKVTQLAAVQMRTGRAPAVSVVVLC